MRGSVSPGPGAPCPFNSIVKSKLVQSPGAALSPAAPNLTTSTEDTSRLGFEDGSSTFMINYRVANLDRMIEQLKRGGVAVEKVKDYDYGRFTWVTDPEGTRIELWEPKGK